MLYSTDDPQRRPTAAPSSGPSRSPPATSAHAEGSALITMGDTVVLCAVSVEDRVPRFAHRHRLRLGHRRVRHAPPLHPHPHAARAQRRLRPHRRDPAPDRPLPALGGTPRPAGRAHLHHRLRRHQGGRRHAHRRDHRRLRGRRAGDAQAGRGRRLQQLPAALRRRRDQRRHHRRHRRCSTWPTKRTTGPPSTSTSS